MALQRRQNRLPWGPFRDTDDWEREFEDIFGRSLTAEQWMPAIDVSEKDDRFMLRADLPGMKMEDINVSIAGNNLILRGEKKSESESKKENYYRAERSYGSFFRSIPFPSEVDTKKIEATYSDGVLEVSMPKMAESMAKKVQITAEKKAKPARKKAVKSAEPEPKQ